VTVGVIYLGSVSEHRLYKPMIMTGKHCGVSGELTSQMSRATTGSQEP